MGASRSSDVQAAVEAAKWWLIDYLTEAGAPVAAADALAAAAQAGFTESQMKHGRARAKVMTRREGFGKGSQFIWTLDPSIPQGDREKKTYAMACQRPTKMHPGGRTGTRTGYEAHHTAGEKACRPCIDAQTAWTLARRRALPPEELAKYRESNNEATKRRYARDPEARKAEHKRYRTTNLDIIRTAKDVPCADCGVRYPTYVMQFDHLDAAQKEFNIGPMGPTRGRARLLAEIAKCEVVCANCHAERTHQRRQIREVS
jgi:hypothetical protein